MNDLIKILPLFIFLASCNQGSVANNNDETIREKQATHFVETYHYDSLTIPSFFKKLIQNHTNDFLRIDSISYLELCQVNEIKHDDSTNIEQFYSIKILHDLFTSQTAANCSKGEILNIPYQWHWVNPNPRHEIYLVENNTLLKDTKPSKDFHKYNSCADIDRTPFLYLSDLMEEEPKHYSLLCDTFSTFGWCSEREMAFICLTELLNFNGKVVAEGNHSWSEFIIPMTSNSGEIVYFEVTVDNTFDNIQWTKIENPNIKEWEKIQGDSPLANWYNKKAHSQSEKQKIKNHLASTKAMNRIENKLVKFLNEKTN